MDPRFRGDDEASGIAVPGLRQIVFGVMVAAAIAAAPVLAGELRHGLSAFGELKYPPEFQHFDYVNPQAPKGGRLVRIGTMGLITYNSFNGFILKGDPAQGLGLLFDTLMARATDEPDAVYGLLAHAAEIADGRRGVTFHLRPEARFADGSPVTAEDVRFSFETLKEKGHPAIALQLKDVAEAEALEPHTIRYRFTGDNTRDLPLIVAGLPVLSKAYYASRRFDETTLEPPLGSGPYRIGPFEQGRYVGYQRRPDYWGAGLPVNRGRFNFAEIRFEYFRDRTAELEALKAGAYDLREDFTARDWASAYDVPAVRDGRLVKEVLPDGRPSGAQGFFLNMRRDKFRDRRVRKALDLAFDFEWTNKNLFYGLYRRTQSFFENSDMKAEGAPDADQVRLIESIRGQVPAEAFGPVYLSPVTDGSGQNRGNLREAAKLLDEAGWTVKDGRRSSAKGEPLTIEFLIFETTFERVIGPFVSNLKLAGIEASIRRVDPAQYQERIKSFDFDATTQRYVIGQVPGPELRTYFGSTSADLPGSLNLAGIRSGAVDALIEKAIAAGSRRELVTATRALDRVLRAEHFWIPHWYKASHNLAYWDKFARPAVQPKYDDGIEDTWWYDEAKAAKLRQGP